MYICVCVCVKHAYKCVCMCVCVFVCVFVKVYIYIYTTWTLTKRMEKKLDGNYISMVRAILNKTWRQHPAAAKRPPTTHHENYQN